jgi:ADP-ribose pyrophosphatase YjhB (NUDIX family)
VNPFKDAEDLQAWLNERGIDTRSWGTRDNKLVVDLWNEIDKGDAELQDDPLLRLVNVVQVVIRKENLVLLEAEQELGSGRRRYRNRPPSEKMRRGESVVDAALRCLEEELRVDTHLATLDESTCTQVSQVIDSPSYPGLSTRYTFHTIEATVKGLPTADFWRENSAFDQHGDPVKRHRWVWRPIKQLPIGLRQ